MSYTREQLSEITSCLSKLARGFDPKRAGQSKISREGGDNFTISVANGPLKLNITAVDDGRYKSNEKQFEIDLYYGSETLINTDVVGYIKANVALQKVKHQLKTSFLPSLLEATTAAREWSK